MRFKFRFWAFVGCLVLVSGAVASCANGSKDTTPICTSAQTLCGNLCVNAQSDTDNCGTCANVCPIAQACVAGACKSVCPYDDTMCGGGDAGGKVTCVDTQSDNANCGGCNKACPNGEVCHAGSCGDQCASGETKCAADASPYCANLKTDNQNCGTCGSPCGTQSFCAGGQCASGCTTDQTLCADAGSPYCATTASDNANCGACGVACTGVLQVCSGGACVSECTATQTICSPDGGTPFCADTLTDNTNCGTCGNVCPVAKPTCVGGTCSNGMVRVLICGAPSSATWNTDIQNNLKGTGAFAAVDVMACNTTTPTVVQLQAYQSVLVFSDTTFADTTTLGNNLVTYVTGGGYVVSATFANSSSSLALGGNWSSGGYNLMTNTGQEEPTESAALIIVDSSSPLVTGVSKLTATAAYRSSGTVTNGGVVVAEWGGGRPLIIRGVKNSANKVELNFYPPSSAVRSDFWVGDGTTIMKNALLYR